MDDLEKGSLEKARAILRSPKSYTTYDLRNAQTFLAAWSEGRADQVPFCGMILPASPRPPEAR